MSNYAMGGWVNLMSNGLLTEQDMPSLLPAAADTARTKIRKAVAYQFAQITTSNGYRGSFLSVADPPIAADSITRYRHVNLYWGNEEETSDSIQGNNQLLDLSMTVTAEVWLDEYNDPQGAIDNAIADVQECFGREYYIPGQDGQRTAFNCLYKGAEPWGVSANTPHAGVAIRLQVWYRLKIDNATLMY